MLMFIARIQLAIVAERLAIVTHKPCYSFRGHRCSKGSEVGMPAVTVERLTQEVASGSYAIKCGLTVKDVRKIWENLCDNIVANVAAGRVSDHTPCCSWLYYLKNGYLFNGRLDDRLAPSLTAPFYGFNIRKSKYLMSLGEKDGFGKVIYIRWAFHVFLSHCINLCFHLVLWMHLRNLPGCEIWSSPCSRNIPASRGSKKQTCNNHLTDGVTSDIIADWFSEVSSANNDASCN